MSIGYMKIAKDAGKGGYPNKKVGQIGLGVGGALCCAGVYGMTRSAVFGIGSDHCADVLDSALKCSRRLGSLMEEYKSAYTEGDMQSM